MAMIVRWIAVAAVAALCGWGILRWSYEPLRCSRAITDLTRRTSAAEQSRSQYERTLRARDNLAQLRALHCPTDVRVPALIGMNEELLGSPEGALAAYREALRIDQRPEIYMWIGDNLMALGRPAEAIDAYATAARFHPFIIEQLNSAEMIELVRERLRAPR